MSKQVNNLQIIQWNCNSLINNCDLISNFLEETKPDIMMLNETKCTYELANFNFNHPSYDILIKERNINPNHGGGVCIIIKKSLNYAEVKDFDCHNEEFICIKIKIDKKECLVGSLYNQPINEINKDLFNDISNKFKHFLIGGDLNSKLIKLGCKLDNTSGRILDEIVETNNLIIRNDKQPTYFEYNLL